MTPGSRMASEDRRARARAPSPEEKKTRLDPRLLIAPPEAPLSDQGPCPTDSRGELKTVLDLHLEDADQSGSSEDSCDTVQGDENTTFGSKEEIDFVTSVLSYAVTPVDEDSSGSDTAMDIDMSDEDAILDEIDDDASTEGNGGYDGPAARNADKENQVVRRRSAAVAEDGENKEIGYSLRRYPSIRRVRPLGEVLIESIENIERGATNLPSEDAEKDATRSADARAHDQIGQPWPKRTPLGELPVENLADEQSHRGRVKISSDINVSQRLRELTPPPPLTEAEQMLQAIVDRNTLLNSGLIAKVYLGEALPPKVWERLSLESSQVLWTVHRTSFEGERGSEAMKSLIRRGLEMLGREGDVTEEEYWWDKGTDEEAKDLSRRVKFTKGRKVRLFREEERLLNIGEEEKKHAEHETRLWTVEDEQREDRRSTRIKKIIERERDKRS